MTSSWNIVDGFISSRMIIDEVNGYVYAAGSFQITGQIAISKVKI